MLNLQWEDLDCLEVEGDLEKILDYSYNAWNLDQRNTRYFVRTFFIKWYLIIDDFDIEDYETQEKQLMNMYEYGEKKLLDVTEVKWIIGYCISLNPEYFMKQGDNYEEVRIKGDKYLHELALANPDDIYLKSLDYDFGTEGHSHERYLDWKRANREQFLLYVEENFNYDSLFSDCFKELITMDL
ncbi:TPA: hypothetical protein UPF84_001907, partial [Listeria monocytogenes]|nr:hypothetical protein [Listeria monocytogenes]HEM2179158.1 hypothetical protein [Listeria monocytogenes]